MILLRCLLTFGLTIAQALPLPVAVLRANAGLAGLARAHFEAQLKDGFSYDLAAAILRAEFSAPDDRAWLSEALQTAPARGRQKFRRFTRTDRGYEITAENGRTFTLYSDAHPGRVLVNGREITFATRSLRAFTREIEAALHQSFVVWDVVVPRADAVAPVLFLVSMSALAIYQTYQMMTGPPNPEVASQAAARLAQLAKICDAERDAGYVTYATSETARTLASLTSEDLVDVARAGGEDCPGEVKRALEAPPYGTKPVPVPRERDLKILCANAGHLGRCVEGFRRERPVQVAEPLDGDGESRSGR